MKLILIFTGAILSLNIFFTNINLIHAEGLYEWSYSRDGEYVSKFCTIPTYPFSSNDLEYNKEEDFIASCGFGDGSVDISSITINEEYETEINFNTSNGNFNCLKVRGEIECVDSETLQPATEISGLGTYFVQTTLLDNFIIDVSFRVFEGEDENVQTNTKYLFVLIDGFDENKDGKSFISNAEKQTTKFSNEMNRRRGDSTNPNDVFYNYSHQDVTIKTTNKESDDVIEAAKKVPDQIKDFVDENIEDGDIKIVVAAYSIGSIVIYNRKDEIEDIIIETNKNFDNKVEYKMVLFDPPYNEKWADDVWGPFLTPSVFPKYGGKLTSFLFSKVIPGASYASAPLEISKARDKGIENYSGTIKWTDGYRSRSNTLTCLHTQFRKEPDVLERIYIDMMKFVGVDIEKEYPNGINPEECDTYMLASQGGTLKLDYNKDENKSYVTAVPDPGYYFAKWTGDIESTKNTIVVNLEPGQSIVANFELEDDSDNSDYSLEEYGFESPDIKGLIQSIKTSFTDKIKTISSIFKDFFNINKLKEFFND